MDATHPVTPTSGSRDQFWPQGLSRAPKRAFLGQNGPFWGPQECRSVVQHDMYYAPENCSSDWAILGPFGAVLSRPRSKYIMVLGIYFRQFSAESEVRFFQKVAICEYLISSVSYSILHPTRRFPIKSTHPLTAYAATSVSDGIFISVRCSLLIPVQRSNPTPSDPLIAPRCYLQLPLLFSCGVNISKLLEVTLLTCQYTVLTIQANPPVILCLFLCCHFDTSHM